MLKVKPQDYLTDRMSREGVKDKCVFCRIEILAGGTSVELQVSSCSLKCVSDIQVKILNRKLYIQVWNLEERSGLEMKIGELSAYRL